MLVSCCGSQKTGASGGAFSGSTGKSQPPLVADFLAQLLRIDIDVAESFEIVIVIIVTAQPFPGEIGCGEIIDMLVAHGQAPQG